MDRDEFKEYDGGIFLVEVEEVYVRLRKVRILDLINRKELMFLD